MKKVKLFKSNKGIEVGKYIAVQEEDDGISIHIVDESGAHVEGTWIVDIDSDGMITYSCINRIAAEEAGIPLDELGRIVMVSM